MAKLAILDGTGAVLARVAIPARYWAFLLRQYGGSTQAVDADGQPTGPVVYLNDAAAVLRGFVADRCRLQAFRDRNGEYVQAEMARTGWTAAQVEENGLAALEAAPDQFA